MLDATLIYVAQRIADRGFRNEAAVEIAKAVGPELPGLFVDDDAKLYVLARPDRDGRLAYTFARSKAEAMDLIDLSNPPQIFDLRRYVEEAMNLLLIEESRNEIGGHA